MSKLLTQLQPADTDERCGFVLASGRVVEVKNIAEDPTKGFRIDPAVTIEWLSKPRSAAVATWHTHPSGDPSLSSEDYACFLAWPGMKHYVIGRRDDAVTVTAYEVEDGLVLAIGGTV
jgi:proteasome lid subunit RPN8/RPN11